MIIPMPYFIYIIFFARIVIFYVLCLFLTKIIILLTGIIPTVLFKMLYLDILISVVVGLI